MQALRKPHFQLLLFLLAFQVLLWLESSGDGTKVAILGPREKQIRGDVEMKLA